MADKPNIHAGHRERLRQRLRTGGLESFSEHEVLELLLTYAIPRQDVNPLAHELIAAFGSLSAVLHADERELMQVKGMGKQAALLLSMTPQLMRYMQLSALGDRPRITNLKDAKDYCAPLFLGVGEERIYLVCMDQAGHVLRRSLLHTGTVDRVSLHPRRVVEIALRCNAYAVVLAHNHPGGMAAPSQADVEMTGKTSSALHAIGIRLADHLIFAGQETYSMHCGCTGACEAACSYVSAPGAAAHGLREECYEWTTLAAAGGERED